MVNFRHFAKETGNISTSTSGKISPVETLGDSRKYSHHSTGSILDLQGRGGLLDWNSEGVAGGGGGGGAGGG